MWPDAPDLTPFTKGQTTDQLLAESCWGALIPHVHRALAAESRDARLPVFNKSFSHPLSCAYWEACNYQLQRLLGWRDPGRGLQWYLGLHGDAPDSPVLKLLERHWNDRGQLRLYAAWAWQHGLPHISGSGGERRPEEFLGEEFWMSFLADNPAPGVACDHDPYWGGTNPLHLGHSTPPLGVDEDEENAGGRLFFSSDKERRAIVTVDRALDWYPALYHRGRELPAGDRSWRVDVYVKPLGWIGQFRQSRETGAWFTGKHSVHLRGQPVKAGE